MGEVVPSLLTTLGEELARSEKLGLAPKVQQNLLVSAELFFNKRLTMSNLPQPQPFCRTPKVPQISGEEREPGPVL